MGGSRKLETQASGGQVRGNAAINLSSRRVATLAPRTNFARRFDTSQLPPRFRDSPTMHIVHTKTAAFGLASTRGVFDNRPMRGPMAWAAIFGSGWPGGESWGSLGMVRAEFSLSMRTSTREHSGGAGQKATYGGRGKNSG